MAFDSRPMPFRPESREWLKSSRFGRGIMAYQWFLLKSPMVRHPPALMLEVLRRIVPRLRGA